MQFKTDGYHNSSCSVILPSPTKDARKPVEESSEKEALGFQTSQRSSISKKTSFGTLSSYLFDTIQIGANYYKVPRSCFILAFMVLVTTSAAAILLGLYLGLRRIHIQAHEVRRTVDLGYSKYTGVGNDDIGVMKWLGIRYAAPPTGHLRFRAPVDPETDSKTYIANQVQLSANMK